MRKFEDGKVYNIFLSCKNLSLIDNSEEQVVFRITIRDIKNVGKIEHLDITLGDLNEHVFYFLDNHD